MRKDRCVYMDKYGNLRQDTAAHWYLIPEGIACEFDKLLEQAEKEEEWSGGWSNIMDKLEEQFGRYRISGYFTDLRVLLG